MRVALRVAYDGTAFYGFQRQPDVRTVEGEIIKALEKLGIIDDPESSRFKGASRTDRGVSAFFNVVAFDVASRGDLVRAEVLNHHLSDVWVLGIAEVPEDFHPRFHAESKTYRYYLVDEGFEFREMERCAGAFVGVHDFSAFAKLEPGRSPVREVLRLDVLKRPGYYVIEIEGKSFLWEMARRIVNAIRFCGLGMMNAGDVREMLEGKYTKKVPPAPAEGLVLWSIKYREVEFKGDKRGIEKAKRDFFERYSRALSRAALFGDFLLEL